MENKSSGEYANLFSDLIKKSTNIVSLCLSCKQSISEYLKGAYTQISTKVLYQFLRPTQTVSTIDQQLKKHQGKDL